MKKNLIFVICASILLSGCGADEYPNDATMENVPIISSVSSENKGSKESAENDTRESELETEIMTVSLSENDGGDNDAYDGYFSKPSREFLDSAFSEASYQYMIKYTEDEKYTLISYEEIKKLMCRDYYRSFFTEESYLEYKDYYESDISFEEYCDQFKQRLGFDLDELENENESPCILFDLDGYSKNDFCNNSEAAFLYLIKFLDSDDERVSDIKNLFGTGSLIEIIVRFEADESENDLLKLSAYYSDDMSRAEDMKEIFSDEYISLSGRDVTTVSGHPVYSDCKSLYLSAYDKTNGTMLDRGENETYDNVIFCFGGESKSLGVDIAEISEKLPCLEKLYLSNFITLENASAISGMEHLKELSVTVSDEKDLKALSGIKLKKLAVSGIDFPASDLMNVDADELQIDCTGSSETLKSIFKLKNVISLTIDRYGESEYDLDGIEELSGLKKLDLRTSAEIDLAPLEKLDSLEDLRILAHHTKNLDRISGLKNVKYLMLHSMNDDLTFLSKMTQLEDLSLMYVNSSFNSAIGRLKKLKRLSLSEITGSVDFGSIYELTELEQLILMGMDINTRGISKADDLRILNIMLCSYGDLSEVKECSSLETLIIYNCETPYFDAKDIEGMTALETLDFNCSEIDNYESLKTLTGLKRMNLFFCDLSSEEIDDLRSSLPNCDIRLEDD